MATDATLGKTTLWFSLLIAMASAGNPEPPVMRTAEARHRPFGTMADLDD